MNKKIKDPVLAQKFMENFSCIGDACEDDCCHGWSIPVEKKAFLETKKIYQNISEKKHAIKVVLKRNKKEKNDWFYGQLNIKDNQQCPFLNQDGLCDIHGRFGPSMLGWVCKDYPRNLVKINDQIAQTMSLSCPEAARLCLLHPGSTQIVEINSGELAGMSGFVSEQGSVLDTDPYVQLGNNVQQVMQMLLDANQYDTNGRLYLLVFFAFKIDDFYHKNTTTFDVDRLSREIEYIATPDVHSKLVSDFHEQEFNPSLSISIVQTLLTFRGDYSLEINDFFSLCMNSCPSVANAKGDVDREAVMADLISTYYDRRNKIEQKYYQRLEGYFYNYISQYIFSKSHLLAPSVAVYLRGLFILLNIIKFLFFLNPLLDSLCIDASEPNDIQEHEALLDKAIVQTCYVCTRGFNHLNQKMMDVIAQVLDEQGVNDLEKLSILAKA